MADESSKMTQPETTETQQAEETTQARTENAPDVQELLVELAKLKRTNDKLSSESAEWRKKYQSKLSEQEKVSEEKAEREAEREEQYNKLLRENQMNKIEKSYLGQGWTADEAERMATAEVDGDFDTRMKILSEVEQRKVKAAKDEFIKSRPELQFGVGTTITKEQFDKMNLRELTRLKRENPTEYERLNAIK